MTKSTGVGRGKGGGRPRKLPRRPEPAATEQVAAPAPSDIVKPRRVIALLKAMTFEQLREMARERAVIAIDTLQDVALNSDKDAARVAAADKLLGWAFDKPKPGQKTKDEGDVPPVDKGGPDSWASLLN